MNPSRPALADFRIEAFLDWVEIRLTLAKPTQARHLRAALPRAWASREGTMPYVMPVSGDRSTTDTVFIVRVQDPPSARTVARDLQVLQERFQFAAPAAITGVEAGIDAHSRHERADVVAMAEHLYRGLSCPVSNNRRITGLKGTKGTAATANGLRRDNSKAFAAGRSVFIGDAGDAVTQRVYVKDQSRARYEVTLTGSEVPFDSLDGWASYKFEQLSHWFRWRLTAPDSSAFGRLLTDRMPVLAKGDAKRARAAHRRVHRPGTVTDTELRDEAVKALRRLSTVQRRGWQSEPTVSASASAPGSAGKLTMTAAQVLDLADERGRVLRTIQGEEHHPEQDSSLHGASAPRGGPVSAQLQSPEVHVDQQDCAGVGRVQGDLDDQHQTLTPLRRSARARGP